MAVIFGKTLFGEDELPKDGDLKNFKIGKDTVVEDMINYAPLVSSEMWSYASQLSRRLRIVSLIATAVLSRRE